MTVTVKETVVEPAATRGHTHPVHTHASNATRELDDLMASLSEFKVLVQLASFFHGSYFTDLKNLLIKICFLDSFYIAL